MRQEIGRENVCYVHVTLAPYIGPAGELKTKPTQHSVRELRSIGIQPDALVLRSDREISLKLKQKISLLCDVEIGGIASAADTTNIYRIPLVLRDEGLDEFVLKHLQIKRDPPDLSEWEALVDRIEHPKGKVRIGLFGKYVDLPDAYLSVIEAIKAGGYAVGSDVEIVWIASDEKTPEKQDPDQMALPHLTSGGYETIMGLDGVLVPGGFGIRGIEGKIDAVRVAREQGIPFLGLCLGLQCAVIEFARNVAGLSGANSTEFDEMTAHPVIDLLPEQEDVYEKGGSMRLGLWPCRLYKGSRAHEVYEQEVIYERHRHRYEVNSAYHSTLQDHGIAFSGTSPDGRLVEIVELPGHPFFMASQFHPEFKSRPNRAHPLFKEFVAAAVRRAIDRGAFQDPNVPEDASGATGDPVSSSTK